MLRDVTLQLPAGTHVTVFGHEAAGKSTLLQVLAGAIKASKGSVLVNGQPPVTVQHIAAGYVSIKESEPSQDTGHQILTSFAKTHQVTNAAARVSELSDVLALTTFLHEPAGTLSTTQLLRLNIARAALSRAPLIMLDDVADYIQPEEMQHLLKTLFESRTVLITTRFAHTADKLQLPVILMHQGTVSHHGTIDEISQDLSCPRIVDIWIEGLRYDLLRNLRKHAGVQKARLMPHSGFSGQHLRIQLRSSRYLPAMYDLVSQAPLIRVEEIPASLNDVIARVE